MTWDPAQYLRYGTERLRPAVELLARVDVDEPAHVVDGGCGPGNVTPFLAQRWPDARIVGVDSSPEMLERARAANPDIEWIEGDLASWQADQPVDVLYSNATLHWLDDHEQAFPRLVHMLATGGVFAVQMPHNHHAPTHTAISTAIEAGPWSERLSAIHRPFPVGDPSFYHDVLGPHLAELDIWETEYLHVLTGEDPVVEWTKGSVLRPLLRELDKEEEPGFVSTYRQEIGAAYPVRADGSTLMPFKRLFIVGRRRESAVA